MVGAERLRSWLEACPYRWLVVFDNADDAGSSTASFPGKSPPRFWAGPVEMEFQVSFSRTLRSPARAPPGPW